MSEHDRKLAVCAAVIAGCVALNVGLAMLPSPAAEAPLEPAPGAVAEGDVAGTPAGPAPDGLAGGQGDPAPEAGSPDAAGAAGAEGAGHGGTAAQDPSPEYEVPLPSDLPEGADPAAAEATAREALAAVTPTAMRIVGSGATGEGESRRLWWRYEVDLADGAKTWFTLGFAGGGFYAGVQ